MLTVSAIFFGIVLLIIGGTALVNGASRIATRLGISQMVVGLTIVAFGTSMPELVVNLIGASHGATELAFGNVVGSNIANLALVLGAAALIRPIEIQGQLAQRELPLLLLATLILTTMSMDTFFQGSAANIGRADAIILLLLFGIFIYAMVLDFVRARKTDQLLADISANPPVANDSSLRFSITFIVVGIVLLYFGGDVTVRNSIVLAQELNIPSATVGLFIVGVGTSLPELVTSIIAAFRRQSDLALGNVVGSNLFNALFVLPITALLGPITIPKGGVSDLSVSFMFAVLLVPVFVFGEARLGRPVGICFILAYFGWAVVRLT